MVRAQCGLDGAVEAGRVGVYGMTGEGSASPRAIWKYEIPLSDRFEIDMPRSSVFLSVDLDSDGKPCLWALVMPHWDYDIRRFQLFGTGQPVLGLELGRYVGSFVLPSDGLVFHLFAEDEEGEW